MCGKSLRKTRLVVCKPRKVVIFDSRDRHLSGLCPLIHASRTLSVMCLANSCHVKNNCKRDV